MELRRYWLVLKRRWLLLTIPAVIVLAIGLATYSTPAPVYNVGVRFIVGQLVTGGHKMGFRPESSSQAKRGCQRYHLIEFAQCFGSSKAGGDVDPAQQPFVIDMAGHLSARHCLAQRLHQGIARRA